MKKILFFLLIIFLSFLSFLVLHDKGNQIIKPYLAIYLESKFEQNTSIEIEHFKFDFNYIEFKALLNNITKVEAQGKLSLFKRTLDLQYTLKSEGFKNKQINFNNQVDINGTAKGTFLDIQIVGKGKTLKSHIDYALNLKDKVINNIKIKIFKADIATLLELTNYPVYAKGKIDMDIYIDTLNALKTEGQAKIILYETLLNEEVFKKELKIDLPKNTSLTANLASNITAQAFTFNGNIKSNLATLKLSNSTYNINSKELLANYVFNTSQLSKLMFLSKKKLNGKLKVTGKLQVKDEILQIMGNSNSLEGEIDFDYNKNTLNTYLNNISISKFLSMLGEKPYATGELTANVKLNDLQNLKGTFALQTKNAKTIKYLLKNELNLNFKKDISFALKSKGNITSNVINIQTTLNSEIFDYRSNDMQHNFKSATLSSSYLLNIPKLSKLNSITGKSLKGELLIHGKIKQNKYLLITGSTKSLGGNIDFELQKKKLTSKMNNVSVEKLMHLLSYPKNFKATIFGNFNYDLKTSKGQFNSRLNNAQLLSNKLTRFIKQIKGQDLTKERFNKTHFNAKLYKDIIDIDFKAKSKTVLLQIPTGRIYKDSNTIDAKYRITIENKDVGGKIKGDISDPRITIDSSDFLKNKVMDVIKKNIPEERLQDLGLDKIKPDEIKDIVKNLLGNLFK